MFAVPSHAAFHYAPLMQIRWRQSEIPSRFHSLPLRKVAALLCLFTTETCEKYPVCLKPSQYGIDLVKLPLRVLRISVKSGLDGRTLYDDSWEQQNTSGKRL